ncbi:MAG: hypothetical protein KA230_09965 [Flavobacteriales bacterium]|nr:hypothetical protein [Flavobacteriales bacterium]
MKRLALLAITLCPSGLLAQDTLPHPRYHEVRPAFGIMVGYSKEIDPENHAPIHFAELGIIRGSGPGGHFESWSYHASSLFGISGSTPILAPRIGVQIGMLLSLGAELVYFTDLANGSLALVPSIGFGGYPLNIAIKPNVYLMNSDFKPSGGGCLSATYRLVSLQRKGRK